MQIIKCLFKLHNPETDFMKKRTYTIDRRFVTNRELKFKFNYRFGVAWYGEISIMVSLKYLS
jgi:hypothetical protein